MKQHVCTQHKKQTMYMYPYKLTKPSLLWFPPSSRVLPKLVNKPPSVHPLQDFPFVVISAGGEGRPTDCQTKFNARPFEGNTDHKHLRGCHINTPQVWQRVRKWKVDMNSSHSRGTDCYMRNQLFQSPSQLSGKHASMWFVVSQKHWFTRFKLQQRGRWCRWVGSRRGTKRFIKFAALFFLSLCRLILSLHPLPLSSGWQLPCFSAARHVSFFWKNQELRLLTGKVPATRLQRRRPSSCSRQRICSVMPSGCKSLCCAAVAREKKKKTAFCGHINCERIPYFWLARTWMRSS